MSWKTNRTDKPWCLISPVCLAGEKETKSKYRKKKRLEQTKAQNECFCVLRLGRGSPKIKKREKQVLGFKT